jgi:hypothetical protein
MLTTSWAHVRLRKDHHGRRESGLGYFASEASMWVLVEKHHVERKSERSALLKVPSWAYCVLHRVDHRRPRGC